MQSLFKQRYYHVLEKPNFDIGFKLEKIYAGVTARGARGTQSNAALRGHSTLL